MDIYQYLKNDHKKVSDLFSDIIAAKNTAKREVFFKQIIEEIVLHAESEHATFYKELKKYADSKDKAQHGTKEHAEIKQAIAKLIKMPFESTPWFVQLGELKHIVEHHVKEEEGPTFKAAKKVISKETAKNLVEKMEKQKQKIKEKSS